MTFVLPAGDQRVREFNLRNQDVIERARIRRIHRVLEAGVQSMGSALSARLRRSVTATLLDTEQLPWDEFRQQIEDPTLISIAKFRGLDGRIVLHVPVDLANFLLELFLSGHGGPQPQRALSDLDVAMVGTLLDDMFAGLGSAIEVFYPCGSPTVSQFRSSIYVRMRRPDEMCLQVGMTLQFGEGDARPLHFYWPISALQPVLDAFDRLQRDADPSHGGSPEGARRRLEHVPLTIRVSYPAVRVSASDVAGLRVGDVVSLGIEASDPGAHLEITSGGHVLGTGRSVQSGKRLACRIASWLAYERRKDRRAAT